jgi:DNA processing protein
LVTPEDEEWPGDALAPLTAAGAAGQDELAPPIALWVAGPLRLGAALARAVSVIGTRAATSYGERVAADLSFALAERGWTVVSGGAYGIDGVAHRGALGADGASVAFLAGGLDRPYPAGQVGLFQRLREAGLLVSEWPIHSTPQKHRFLVRNRLIAGVSIGTVVIEAARRSGTQSTARRACELGRTLMAVPGPVSSAVSAGIHDMIRNQGAKLVTCADEVIEDIGALGVDLASAGESRSPRDELDSLSARVLDGFPARKAVSVEALARECGLSAREVIRALPVLEIGDFVRRDADGWRLRR